MASKWIWRLVVLAFIAVTTIGPWLPPIVIRATATDYHFPRSRSTRPCCRTGTSSSRSAGFLIAGAATGYGIWTAVWALGGSVGWLLVPVSLLALVGPSARSPRGSIDRSASARLAAFRRYLRGFSDLPNAPATAVIIWERYLEWAVALGVADEAEKHVVALVPAAQRDHRCPVVRATRRG